jgi:DNA-binding LacI/PurR family transcriptional regulator
MALVAIDDPFWSELVDPPLTTLAQPVRNMATTAVELLIDRLQQRTTEVKEIVFPFELRIRQSCGMNTTRSNGKPGSAPVNS